MNAEENLKKLGLVLPEPPQAAGSYVPVLQIGDLLFLSGVLSRSADGVLTGRAGEDSTVERGQQAARLAALAALSVIRQHLGGLDRVKRIVRVVGYVQSGIGFTEIPKVLNGASALPIYARANALWPVSGSRKT